MKERAFIFLVASVTLSAALCLAQEAPVTTAVKHLQDGLVAVKITNHHQHALTACLLEVERAPSTANGPRIRTTLYYDTVLNPWHDTSLAPGKTRVVGLFEPPRGPTPLQTGPKFKAAVFEDGTAFGDSDAIARVIAARKRYFEELEKAIKLVQSAQSSHITRDELMREFSQKCHTDLAGVQGREEERAVSEPWEILVVNLPPNSRLPLENLEGAVLQMFIRLRQNPMLAGPVVAPPGAIAYPGD